MTANLQPIFYVICNLANYHFSLKFTCKLYNHTYVIFWKKSVYTFFTLLGKTATLDLPKASCICVCVYECTKQA
jgi:hypothetical protein